jgi:hypothetical protein
MFLPDYIRVASPNTKTLKKAVEIKYREWMWSLRLPLSAAVCVCISLLSLICDQSPMYYTGEHVGFKCSCVLRVYDNTDILCVVLCGYSCSSICYQTCNKWNTWQRATSWRVTMQWQRLVSFTASVCLFPDSCCQDYWTLLMLCRYTAFSWVQDIRHVCLHTKLTLNNLSQQQRRQIKCRPLDSRTEHFCIFRCKITNKCSRVLSALL